MLSREEVKKLARLARIKFREDELEKFRTQLSNILDFIAQLEEVPTKDVEPTSQVTGLKNITRADQVEKWVTRDEILTPSNLPKRDGMIEVPSVFE